jgi:hypothetical protein
MEIISSSIHKPALSAGLPEVEEEKNKLSLVCMYYVG